MTGHKTMSNKFYLVHNQYNKEKSPEHYAYAENNLSLVDIVEDCDYILIIGGDGSLLDTIQKYKKYKKPFLGIHTGTIGYYMHNFSKIEDISTLNTLKFEIAEFPMLSFIAKNEQGDFFQGEAFADVWVERTVPQSLKYNICINDINDQRSYCNINKNTIIGDGILFSTPAGSTGYTKNLGGNIIPFDVPVFQVVPMASAIDKKNIPSFPLGLENNSAEVSFQHVDFRKNTLIYDGISAINPKDSKAFIPKELIVKKSDNVIKIAFISISDFKHKAIEWILD